MLLFWVATFRFVIDEDSHDHLCYVVLNAFIEKLKHAMYIYSRLISVAKPFELFDIFRWLAYQFHWRITMKQD